MALKNAARLAKKHGFRTVVERIGRLGATVLTLAFTCATLAMATMPAPAAARAADDVEPRGETSASSQDRGQSQSLTRGERASTSTSSGWVFDIWSLFMSPFDFDFSGALYKGEGDDPGFSDNGPEE